MEWEMGMDILVKAIRELEGKFDSLPRFTPKSDWDQVQSVLMLTAERMKDNYPYHHPYYLGQMIKPPHPIARLAYSLSLLINPNNHAIDGGRASSIMEKEAVAAIAKMFGWTDHLGHLTSGGTMANLEALWIASRLHPGKLIVASKQAHYTHHRICGVLSIPFLDIPCDHKGRMDMDHLRQVLESENIGTVVATLGTTATGSIDPLVTILKLQEQFGFRIHVDSAYGGYYVLSDNLAAESRAAFDHISEADSLVVDPHKHGLQPYGCGCVLFKDPKIGKFYQHESPYTYFTSEELHLGEISLECSRPGASAVALWATQQLFPMKEKGEFAGNLSSCRSAALELYSRLKDEAVFVTAFEPELDIVIWLLRGSSASECSRLSDEYFSELASKDIHIAKAIIPRRMLEPHGIHIDWDQDHITCLRACLMKPEHEEWLDRIFTVLKTTALEVTGSVK